MDIFSILTWIGVALFLFVRYDGHDGADDDGSYAMTMHEAPCHEGGCLPKVYGFLKGGLWSSSWTLVQKILGEKNASRIKYSYHYAVEMPNPLFQLFYCVLMAIIVTMWMSWCYSKISPLERFIIISTLMVTTASFLSTSMVDPGTLKTNNVNKFDVYEPDDVLYPRKKRECETCHIQRCVARFDHHCVWFNNCIGQRNYKHFHLFLISHVFACFYGLFLAYEIVRDDLVRKKFWDMYVKNRETGELTAVTTIDAGWFVMFHARELVAIMIFLGVIGVTLLMFWLYHLYLAALNLTTNESIKRKTLDAEVSSIKKLRQVNPDVCADVLEHYEKNREGLPVSVWRGFAPGVDDFIEAAPSSVKPAPADLDERLGALVRRYKTNYYSSNIWSNLKEIIVSKRRHVTQQPTMRKARR